MKPYLVVFNKEITDIDKLFGFQIMSKEQMKNYIKSVKKLEDDGIEFEINGESYDYSNSDFDVQSITLPELKVLAKLFEFDYDPSSGESQPIGIIPDAIEQFYYEYPNCIDDENDDMDENNDIDEYDKY